MLISPELKQTTIPSKVAIIIPVMNRAEFIERQLKYYSSVNCAHPIYIADGSTGAYAQEMESMVKKWNGRLAIHLKNKPQSPIDVSILDMLNNVVEQYACIIGDDDFQIPSSLTKCTEFLDAHPDYSSAHGHGVTIRIKDNAVYGPVTKIKDYPQPQYESARASERVLEFFNRYYVSLFSVGRTREMHEFWEHAGKSPDVQFSCEIIPCALMLAHGKSKLIDVLGFVRQIHDRHKPVPNYFDWITEPGFSSVYHLYEQSLAGEIAQQDTIPIEDARTCARQGFWLFLHTQMQQDYHARFPASTPSQKTIRQRLATLPWLTRIYRRIKPYLKKNLPLHAEVTRPGSAYFEDFENLINIISHYQSEP